MYDLDIIKYKLAEEKRARKQADSQLVEHANELAKARKGLAEMASIVAGVPYPVIQFDKTGTVTFANPASIRYWGRGVVPGESLFNELAFIKDLNINDIIDGEEALQFHARKKGEYFRFIFKGDPRQEVCHLYCLDITEYELEKLELQQASMESEELLTSLSSVLIGVDHEGCVILWNRTAEALFGVKEVDVLGRPLAASGIEWDTDKIDGLISNCQENASFYEEKLAFTKLNGEEGLLEIVFTPVAQQFNRRAGVFLLARDITNLPEPNAPDQSWDEMGEIIQMVASLAEEMSEPVQNISANMQYLDSAISGIRDLLEKNLVILEGREDSYPLEQHMLELEDIVRSIQIDKLIKELPDTVGDTISMISKVARLLKSAKQVTLES